MSEASATPDSDGDGPGDHPAEGAEAATIPAAIADRLRREILTGTIPPGSPIKERDHAERLGISRTPLREAVRSSNMDVGGRTVELSEFEFMVRGRGYLDGIADLEMVPIRAEGGVPVLLRDVARVAACRLIRRNDPGAAPAIL